MTKRTPERLIQIARSVNDAVVGEHIGQLCRDLADQLEISQDTIVGALVVVQLARRLLKEQSDKQDSPVVAKPSPPAIIVSIGGDGS